MKNVKDLFAACALFALMQTAASASVTITNNTAKFNPVQWRLTQDNASYGIVNDTPRTQIIFVTLKQGTVLTYASSFDGESGMDCLATLSDKAQQNSISCELKSHYTFHIEKDLIDENDAIGTYQVEMSRSAA